MELLARHSRHETGCNHVIVIAEREQDAVVQTWLLGVRLVLSMRIHRRVACLQLCRADVVMTNES